MSHARALPRFALCLALASGCSFTTATGFEECKSDLDCAASSVCSVHYCLPLGAGCQRVCCNSSSNWSARERICSCWFQLRSATARKPWRCLRRPFVPAG